MGYFRHASANFSIGQASLALGPWAPQGFGEAQKQNQNFGTHFWSQWPKRARCRPPSWPPRSEKKMRSTPSWLPRSKKKMRSTPNWIQRVNPKCGRPQNGFNKFEKNNQNAVDDKLNSVLGPAFSSWLKASMGRKSTSNGSKQYRVSCP